MNSYGKLVNMLKSAKFKPEKELAALGDDVAAYDAYRELADSDPYARLADSKLRNKMRTVRWKDQSIRNQLAKAPDLEKRDEYIKRLAEILAASPYYKKDLVERVKMGGIN